MREYGQNRQFWKHTNVVIDNGQWMSKYDWSEIWEMVFVTM